MAKSILLLLALTSGVGLAAPWKSQNVPASKAPGKATITFAYRGTSGNQKAVRLTPTFISHSGEILSNNTFRIKATRSWKTHAVVVDVPTGSRLFKLEGKGTGYRLRSVKVTYKKDDGIKSPGTTGIGVPTGKENVASSNPAYEQEVFRLINVERTKAGLRTLTWHEGLARAARYHANDMAVDNYFNHDTMDRDKNGNLVFVCLMCWRVWYFIDTYGGENIAKGQATPEEVVADWMASPPHRANILRSDARQTAIGYVNGHWVQDFLL